MTRALTRWIASAAVVATAAACAHIEAPPGGDPDQVAPTLLVTQPDTLARLQSFAGPAVFVFSEGLSEEGVDDAVTVSPRTSGLGIRKVGDEIRVNLRGGWERGRIYQVELAPGIQDLFGNKTTERYRLVFSTGPEIPDTRVTGVVIDRETAQPAIDVRVEAALTPDSLVYTTRSDSAGRYELAQIPAGDYRVRAFKDQNQNRGLEEFEPRDTLTLRVEVGRPAEARRLSIVEPDTSPPRPGSATYADGVVEIKFEDFLDPEQTVAASQVAIVPAAGGAAVALSEVRLTPFPGAPADSADADADSAVAPAPAAQPGGVAPPARDTTRNAPVGPVPSQSIFVRTAAPLLPETEYRVTVTGVRNLVGLVGGGDTELKTPRPAPPRAAPAAADTAAGDSVAPAPPAQNPPATQNPAPAGNPQTQNPPAPQPQTPPGQQTPAAPPPRPRD